MKVISCTLLCLVVGKVSGQFNIGSIGRNLNGFLGNVGNVIDDAAKSILNPNSGGNNDCSFIQMMNPTCLAKATELQKLNVVDELGSLSPFSIAQQNDAELKRKLALGSEICTMWDSLNACVNCKWWTSPLHMSMVKTGLSAALPLMKAKPEVMHRVNWILTNRMSESVEMINFSCGTVLPILKKDETAICLRDALAESATFKAELNWAANLIELPSFPQEHCERLNFLHRRAIMLELTKCGAAAAKATHELIVQGTAFMINFDPTKCPLIKNYDTFVMYARRTLAEEGCTDYVNNCDRPTPSTTAPPPTTQFVPEMATAVKWTFKSADVEVTSGPVVVGPTIASPCLDKASAQFCAQAQTCKNQYVAKMICKYTCNMCPTVRPAEPERKVAVVNPNVTELPFWARGRASAGSRTWSWNG